MMIIMVQTYQPLHINHKSVDYGNNNDDDNQIDDSETILTTTAINKYQLDNDKNIVNERIIYRMEEPDKRDIRRK